MEESKMNKKPKKLKPNLKNLLSNMEMTNGMIPTPLI